MTAKEGVEFQCELRRLGGDGEELRLTFAIPQTEIRLVQPLLAWGKCLLTVTVVKEP